MIVRLDAIGDYVLFRYYIEIVKKSEKYKDYSITLLGNISWKSISNELDKEIIDEFLWLDRNKFIKDFKYRYTKLQEITSKEYEVLLNPVYSREFFLGDSISKLVCAKEKITSKGDLSNIEKWQKDLTDNYFTNLIEAKNDVLFEFDRNKEFFENLFDINLDIIKPYIELKDKNLGFSLPKNYVVFFIGASAFQLFTPLYLHIENLEKLLDKWLKII